MGLLDTIRSLLGLDGDGTDRGTQGGKRTTDVRVEHKPDERTTVDAGSEAAVDETDDSPDDEPVAAETDAAASTGSLAEVPDEPEESAEAAEATEVTDHAGAETEAAEPGEAAGPTPDEPDTEGVDAAAEDEVESETAPADETEGAEEPDETVEPEGAGAGGESVQSINGIGQAYGKRLADAGVETVAELADADAAELADASGISERRIVGWQEAAADRLE